MVVERSTPRVAARMSAHAAGTHQARTHQCRRVRRRRDTRRVGRRGTGNPSESRDEIPDAEVPLRPLRAGLHGPGRREPRCSVYRVADCREEGDAPPTRHHQRSAVCTSLRIAMTVARRALRSQTHRCQVTFLARIRQRTTASARNAKPSHIFGPPGGPSSGPRFRCPVPKLRICLRKL